MAQKRETAFAKINLALHVRERLPDGYHRIETIFAFCEDGDILTAEPSDRLSLDVTGPFGHHLTDPDDNLVLRAARAVGATAAMTLDKRLPVASGIGGGSADAAATLRLLDHGDDMDLARSLGADVAPCLVSRSVRGDGRGDELRPVDLPELSGIPILLVNPGIPLSTAAVFDAWDGRDRGPLGDWRSGRNDLEYPARILVPEIALVLEALETADFARMSGSGATCFGLFASEEERDEVAATIRLSWPAWWILPTRLKAS